MISAQIPVASKEAVSVHPRATSYTTFAEQHTCDVEGQFERQTSLFRRDAGAQKAFLAGFWLGLQYRRKVVHKNAHIGNKAKHSNPCFIASKLVRSTTVKTEYHFSLLPVLLYLFNWRREREEESLCVIKTPSIFTLRKGSFS